MHRNPVAWLSLKSVRVLGVTHLELRTVVIQGFLIKAVCQRARLARLVSQTTKPQSAFNPLACFSLNPTGSDTPGDNAVNVFETLTDPTREWMNM